MPETLLISGGSRGIGKACVELAAQKGWHIAFTYKNNEKAAADTVKSAQILGGQCLAIKADAAREFDVINAFDQTLAQFGCLDHVVVNAGVVGPSMTLAEMNVERMRSIFDTNIMGAFLFAREAARRLSDARVGEDASIVFVSSIAALLGSAFEYVDYAASKGAVDTLTRGLAKELAPHKIRVNGVRPGVINTDIHASCGQPGRAIRIGKTVPLGRAGEANEIAKAIMWLSSGEASYCSGSIIDISGGR